MAKRILKSKGRTAEEAIDHGLRKIHLPRESVEVRLLREGRKILGLIPWDAIVYLIYDPLSTEVSPGQECNSRVEEALEQVEDIVVAENVEEEINRVKEQDETGLTGQEQVEHLSNDNAITSPPDDNSVPPAAEKDDK